MKPEGRGWLWVSPAWGWVCQDGVRVADAAHASRLVGCVPFALSLVRDGDDAPQFVRRCPICVLL